MEEVLQAHELLMAEWAALAEERHRQEGAKLAEWLDNGGREWLQSAAKANDDYHAHRKAKNKERWKKIANVAVKGAACVCGAGAVLFVPVGAAVMWSLIFGAVANVDQIIELWPSSEDPDRKNLDRIYEQLEKTPAVRQLH